MSSNQIASMLVALMITGSVALSGCGTAQTMRNTPIPISDASTAAVTDPTALPVATAQTTGSTANATPSLIAAATPMPSASAQSAPASLTEQPLATPTEQPLVAEQNPAGDIPDTQAFVRYTASPGGYSLEVPEGWARATQGDNARFVDKLDGLSVMITAAQTAPTAASASTHEVAALVAAGRAVTVGQVSDVQLPGGSAVQVQSTANSDPDPVTNKQVRQEQLTYLFFKNGKLATLTLWAPLGADNVDQWQRIAQSFQVQQRARNLEARIAGSGVVGDNLAARLDGVRADALYARVLFLFLGVPGAVLAMVLTLAVTAAGGARRRQEQGLLRTRGATTSQILRLEGCEALVVGLGGIALGFALAGAATAIVQMAGVSNETLSINTTDIAIWRASAALVGMTIAIVAVLLPAWIQVRQTTVAAQQVVVERKRIPLWQRLYLDGIVLLIAAVMFWRTASTGYQIVLAPEGVPQTSVAYEAFLAPLALWIGAALLTLRLWNTGLQRGRQALAGLLRPIAYGLANVVAAAISRQHTLIARGVVLVALAFAFASSTAIFNTIYNAQARVDAELTNGADVRVSGSSTVPPGNELSALAALPGVAAAEPMQHRFAYVGNDLQDLYGIDPHRISQVTPMSNAFFAGGNAQTTLATLAARPDGLLVSEETVTDFQLTPGDQINLRLQNAQDHQYHVVPFHLVGVVREFPTAPKDSFLVANASYIAQQTNSDAAEIVLLRTTGDPATVAAQARAAVVDLSGVTVSDITTTQQTISSSLTAVDLRGLTALELAFAVLLVAGATGLVLALGLAERRRIFAILAALGARQRQLGIFLWSEGLLILVGGGVIGTIVGLALAQMLVVILTGVFDPPPEALAIPWSYLMILLVAAVVSTTLAIGNAQRMTSRKVIETLRGL